ATGQFREFAAQFDDVGTRVDDRLTNFGAKLDDGLVHLRLDLLFKRYFPALEDLLDVRPKLARLRIDDRELLFNTQSKRVVLSAHVGRQISLKNARVSSP